MSRSTELLIHRVHRFAVGALTYSLEKVYQEDGHLIQIHLLDSCGVRINNLNIQLQLEQALEETDYNKV